MTRDKKDYVDLLAIINSNTLKPQYSTVKKLTELMYGTEDLDLKRLIKLIRDNCLLPIGKRGASLRIQIPIGHQYVRQAISYCEKMLENIKPQWQILAEKHGWTPPPS